MPRVTDFYQANLLRGQDIITITPWVTGSTPTTIITALAAFHTRIDSLVIFASDDFALASGTIDITPWGNAVPAKISLANMRDLYSVATSIGHKNAILSGGANYHWLRIDFRPFIFLDSAASFTIAHSVGATEALTGTINFTVRGATISDVDD
jgi:hypothetical protein